MHWIVTYMYSRRYTSWTNGQRASSMFISFHTCIAMHWKPTLRRSNPVMGFSSEDDSSWGQSALADGIAGGEYTAVWREEESVSPSSIGDHLHFQWPKHLCVDIQHIYWWECLLEDVSKRIHSSAKSIKTYRLAMSHSKSMTMQSLRTDLPKKTSQKTQTDTLTLTATNPHHIRIYLEKRGSGRFGVIFG